MIMHACELEGLESFLQSLADGASLRRFAKLQMRIELTEKVRMDRISYALLNSTLRSFAAILIAAERARLYLLLTGSLMFA